MASDFSSRIGARSGSLTTRDRPTPDDIDDLRRRQDEHAKRTQEEPKKSFESYLESEGEDAAQDQQDQPHADQQPEQKDAEGAEPPGHAEPHSVPPSPRDDMLRGKPVAKPMLPPLAGGRGRIIRG